MPLLPAPIASRLQLPLIAAPMFRISGDDLVIATCRAGAIGAFPTANCRTVDELDRWLTRFERELTTNDAPFCPNLIIRRSGLADDVACLRAHHVEVVITSVGSPEPVVEALHEAGCLILADVASVRHAEKAVRAGADGLVLLTAGAGGQTGWANGFAFVRAVREWYDGIVVLAGGIADGQALFAARALGCDLAYMGTRFIATQESMADQRYKDMLVASRLDDITLTTAMTGLETNLLRPSVVAAGLDPDALPDTMSTDGAAALYGQAASSCGPHRWRDIWSAGHAVSAVHAIPTVAQLVHDTRCEYDGAQATMRLGL